MSPTQVISGILPQRIETDQYFGEMEEETLCNYCDLEEIENETHLNHYCPFYHSQFSEFTSDITPVIKGL